MSPARLSAQLIFAAIADSDQNFARRLFLNPNLDRNCLGISRRTLERDLYLTEQIELTEILIHIPQRFTGKRIARLVSLLAQHDLRSDVFDACDRRCSKK